jgi:hypothetical protein
LAFEAEIHHELGDSGLIVAGEAEADEILLPRRPDGELRISALLEIRRAALHGDAELAAAGFVGGHERAREEANEGNIAGFDLSRETGAELDRPGWAAVARGFDAPRAGETRPGRIDGCEVHRVAMSGHRGQADDRDYVGR